MPRLSLCLIALSAGSMLSAATLIHSYNLTVSLSDQVGSVNLLSDGGTVVPGTGYQFLANQGLHNPSGIPITDGLNYTFFLRFEFDAVTGFRKMIDLTNRSNGPCAGTGGTCDPGLYNISGNLQWYNATAGSGVPLAAGVFADVVLTRDGGGVVSGYVNGALQFSFADVFSSAIFQNDPGQVVSFFEDDSFSSFTEASSGTAKVIQVFDGALSPAEIAVLPQGIAASAPEPGALLLLASGAAALLLRRRADKPSRSA